MNKTIGIMQPYFLPYIGYWQLINYVDEYIIYDDVNFIKNGWIHRNKIYYSNDVRYINLNLERASQNKKINEIILSNDKNHYSNLLKLIYFAYHDASEFKDIYSLMDKIINFEEYNLALYLTNQIKEISKYLGIDTKIILSSTIKKNNQLTGEDKIIHICKNQEANLYINAIGGMNLYSTNRFNNEGLQLNFLECINENINYFQKSEKFISNLSILDVMMYNKVDKIQEFLKQYKLMM